MAPWLTPTWVEESARVLGTWPPADGRLPPLAPVAVAVTVTGGPEGDAHWERRWWATPGATGSEATTSERGDRILALTIPAATAGAILRGDLSPSVAFMQGRLKTSGDQGAVLDVLAATATDAFRATLAKVRTVTDQEPS